MDPIEQLIRLVKAGFTGTAQPEFLIYMRWWSSDVLDSLTVLAEDRSVAYRAYGMNPTKPEDISSARLDWKQSGPVVLVVNELLSLPEPRGVRTRVRAADADATALNAMELIRRPVELWTP
jgi:hypothetical protein